MKRLYISVVLLAAIICISGYSLYDLHIHKEAIVNSAAELRDMARYSDPQQLRDRGRQLFDDWNQREKILVLYIRHDTLDQITQLLAELPALAEHEDWAAFFGRLDVVTALMDDLWESNKPTYRNLL